MNIVSVSKDFILVKKATNELVIEAIRFLVNYKITVILNSAKTL